MMASGGKYKTRGLSEKFIKDLKPEGILNPILEQLTKDQTVMLAIRNDYNW